MHKSSMFKLYKYVYYGLWFQINSVMFKLTVIIVTKTFSISFTHVSERRLNEKGGSIKLHLKIILVRPVIRQPKHYIG